MDRRRFLLTALAGAVAAGDFAPPDSVLTFERGKDHRCVCLQSR